MGAEFDPQDSISQLANAHFPELSAFDEAGSAGMDGGMTNLDFMTLGDGGEWSMGKEWGSAGTGLGTGSDLDGFPTHGSFGMGFGGGEGKF